MQFLANEYQLMRKLIKAKYFILNFISFIHIHFMVIFTNIFTAIKNPLITGQ